MTDRITTDELLDRMSDETTAIVNSERNVANVEQAIGVIKEKITDFVEHGGFKGEQYKVPIKGLTREMANIESETLLSVTKTQYTANGGNFDLAHRDGAMCAFLTRQLLVEAFVDECRKREEVLQTGTIQSSDGFNSKAAEQAIMAHFAISLVEINETGIDFTPEEYTRRSAFKSEMFGMLVEYGLTHPDRIEQVIYDVDKVFWAKQEAFEKDVENSSVLTANGNSSPIQIQMDIKDTGMNEFWGRKKGIRSELIAHEICRRVVTSKDESRVLFEVAKKLDLQIEKATLDQDTKSDVDFVITGLVDGGRKVLVGIDVVAEMNREELLEHTIGLALTAPVKSAGERYIVEKPIKQHGNSKELLADEDLNSDPLTKGVTDQTYAFVAKTGIPVVSVRIPTEYLRDDFGHYKRGERRNNAIAWGYLGTPEQQKALGEISVDLLDYSLKTAVVNCLKIKYGK